MRMNESTNNEESILSRDQTCIALPQALEIVGDANYYQWRSFLIMCIAVSTVSFHITGQAFIFVQPALLCDGQPCTNFGPDYCNSQFTITVDRDNFKYDNVVTEFNLWCYRKNLATIAQSMFFFGSLFGGIIMSYLGDKYGRRKMYIISWVMFTSGSIGLLTSQSIYQYMAMNMIMGSGGININTLNFVILNEISSKKFRQTASVGILIVYSLAQIYSSFMYYVLDDWRLVLFMGIVIPALFELLLIFMLKETPQYYCTKNQISKLIASLDEIAIINKKQTFTSLIPMIQDRLHHSLKQVDSNNLKFSLAERSYSIFDLFKYKSLRNATIGFTFIIFTLNLIYYGAEYSISDIQEGRTLYILGAVLGFAEVFAYILISFIIDKLSRKKNLLLSFVFSILFCGCFIFFGWSAQSCQEDCNFCRKQIFVITLACVIRIFNSFGFALQALHANEIYPTCIRSLATGFLFSIVLIKLDSKGITGSFISPYVIALANTIQINVYILIGAFSIFGPFACLLIKETLNKKLLNQIREEVVQNIKDYSDFQSEMGNSY